MYPNFSFVAILIAAASVNAHSNHDHAVLHERPKRLVSTVTHKSIVTSIVTAPETINTDISSTGIYTFIPGALTMTFKAIPAYVYIETVVETKSIITFQFVTTSQISSPSIINKDLRTSTPTISPTKALTSIVLPSSANLKSVTDSTAKANSNTKSVAPTKSTTKTSVKSQTSTSLSSESSSACCKNNGYTVTKSSACDGKDEGATCGSFHTCYQGGCYWFNHDDMCGSLTNACNTDAGYLCVNGDCTNVLNDPNNCGLAYRVCGDNWGNPYGCSKGECVNLNGDSNNCGAVGKVCGTGKGCLAGKCIDTTSDDNNCSVPTYKCPSGTKCKDSWCQPK